MVVISIIAVLSSVVMSSVISASMKGRNALVRRQVKEITNALYLARDASPTGQFPGVAGNAYCFLPTGSSCFATQAVGDNAVLAAINTYMSTIPVPPNPPYLNNGIIKAGGSYAYFPGMTAGAMGAGSTPGTYLVWPQESPIVGCKGIYWTNVTSGDGYYYCLQNIETNP